MSKGKRYDVEPHLNLKKVFAVILVIVIIVGAIMAIKNAFANKKDSGKITSPSYFAVYADNKWGVIDSAGNEVISPAYQEMIKVPNNKKDVFLCTYDINDETGEYKTKALNSKNEEIFKDYSQIEAIENVDKNNNVWYEENLLKVQKDGKYGLIDFSGKQILPCEYDQITVIKGVKNSIKIQKDNKVGLVNDEGTVVIQPTYADITNLGDDYKDGYIVTDANNKQGVVDYTGKQLLANQFEKVEQINGKDQFVVTEANKQKLVNSNGEDVLTSGYDSIKQILGYTTQGIVFVKDNKCGVMDLSGKTLISNTYDDLKEVKDGIFIAKRGDKYGIVDQNNQTKVDFIYTNITYNKTADIFTASNDETNSSVLDGNFNVKLTGIVSEVNEDKGYLKIRIDDEYKYYNFKFEEKSAQDILPANTLFVSKKDGKFGFVDAKGNVVVDYQYDDATEQNSYGYAGVKKDGKWGSIDTNGNVIIEPTYDLDNNYVIDFIGKWHLGQDVNMNYYCEK